LKGTGDYKKCIEKIQKILSDFDGPKVVKASEGIDEEKKIGDEPKPKTDKMKLAKERMEKMKKQFAEKQTSFTNSNQEEIASALNEEK